MSHPNHHSVVRNIYLPHQDIGENTSYHILQAISLGWAHFGKPFPNRAQPRPYAEQFSYFRKGLLVQIESGLLLQDSYYVTLLLLLCLSHCRKEVFSRDFLRKYPLDRSFLLFDGLVGNHHRRGLYYSSRGKITSSLSSNSFSA